MTSHAAVVARGMGTCCVAGCGDIVIHEDEKLFQLGGKTIHEGDYISLDGTTGNIYGEAIKTVPATISGDFGRLMGWADEDVYKRQERGVSPYSQAPKAIPHTAYRSIVS